MSTLLDDPAGTTVTLYAVYEQEAGGTVIVYGDVNGDGVINTVDAGWVLTKYANSATVFPCGNDDAGDVNGDGVINTVDAGWVLTKYANSSTVFPAEEK